MKQLLPICLLLTLTIPSIGQRKLEKGILPLIKGFHGEVGIYVKNLKTGAEYGFQADTIFPTASIVKLPIYTGIMDKMRQGLLSDTQHLVYKDSLLYEGVDILGSFRADERIELSKVIMLMLTMSDNTASLWLQSLAGGGIRINQLMDSMGFRFTRVNSKTPGRESDRARFGWGQTTPREMGRYMEKLYRHQLFSDSISDRMLKQTSRNYWDAEGLSAIPAGIFVSSKNGAVDASRSEVMLVYAPRNPYIFCLFTKNNQDTTWETNNEAWVMTRRISRFLWEYFTRK